MTVSVNISTDILAILALSVTIWLAKKNMIQNRYRTNYYLMAALTTNGALLLEIATELLRTQPATTLVVALNHAANAVGFMMMPIILYALILMENQRMKRYRRILVIPAAVNAAMSLLSIHTKWLFFVDENNVYSRGPLFWFQISVCLLYAAIFLSTECIIAWKTSRTRDENIFLGIIFAGVVIGVCVQLRHPKILLMWGCTAIGLLLYYIFYRELQFKYDPLTGIENRAYFQKAMDRLRAVPWVFVAVFDLDDLKTVNDTQGHIDGDKVIQTAGQMLSACFEGKGTAYRIGGDEFCVLAPNMRQMDARRQIKKLIKMAQECRETTGIEVYFSYGYEFFDPDTMRDLYEAFSHADAMMYQHKREKNAGRGSAKP